MLHSYQLCLCQDQAGADDAENVMTLPVFLIMFMGSPVLCCSNLQVEIALSTTEAEYITLFQEMRGVIPFMIIMK